MSQKEKTFDIDFTFLEEATKLLLGYFVHRKFKDYLDVLYINFQSLFKSGLIHNFAEPTEKGRYTMLFNFYDLDINSITYINGLYYYILAAHKNANFYLLNKHEKKQILYLRGFDFEGSVDTGSGVAMGFSSTDTIRFNHKLKELLFPDFLIFKVFSPKDIYWDAITAERYFYGDYNDIVNFARYKMCSVFLNAAHWKEGISQLLDRMDHYIVYMSSITESVLWELEQLNTDDRRKRVTVVFDEKAIKDKVGQLNMRGAMQYKFGDKLIWSKKGSSPTIDLDNLREQLSSAFLVTNPEAFEADIEEHRKRISNSPAALAPGSRETFLDFNFYPSFDDARSKNLLEILHFIETQIKRQTKNRGIDCLPLFFNLVQLWVFITLLMGEHFETGRALATYAATIKGAYDYYSNPENKVGVLSKERRQRNLELLLDHEYMATDISWYMLSYGKSNQFNDFRPRARTTFETEFSTTKTAVDSFFSEAIARNKI
jgi:hypothetical protein